MLGFWTLVVFVSVAVVTAALLLRLTDWRTRAAERLAARPESVSAFIPSPSLIWHELVDRIGSLVPASPKDLPQLKKRLIRAGFRGANAPNVFNGARGAATLGLALIALAGGYRAHVSLEKMLYLTMGGAMLGYIVPGQYLSFCVRRRQHAVEKGLPNALDLLVVCVESGLGLDQAIIQVAKELQFAYPEICEEFSLMNLEMRAGKRRVEALHNLAERTGVEELKKLVAVLIQTDKFGTSIAQSLRGHSDYMRVMARQRAEERAAKLAVKLVFPIFFCVLPSLFVVTIGPVMTKLIRDLIPMIENM